MTEPSTRWRLTTDAESIEIEADPDRVYELVSDLSRMGEWSPECAAVEWTDGATGPATDARFIGHNRAMGGLMRWSRKGRVLAADPGREFTFTTEEGGKEGVVWRYTLEAVAGGTKVTESYEIGWIPMWARIVDVPTNRAKALRKGMRHTLEQLKATAEVSR